MRKNPWVIVSIICLLILIGMVTIDLHLVSSKTNSDHLINKYTLGIETGKTIPQVSNLNYYVEGSDTLSNRLRKKLPGSLSNNPAFLGNIQLMNERAEKANNPILVVEIKQKSLVWTPAYSRAELSIDFGYSSTGDIRWRYDDQDVVKMQESPSAYVDGEIIIRDNSFGFMTWRGYQNLLAEIAANHINTNLTQQLTANQNWESVKNQ